MFDLLVFVVFFSFVCFHFIAIPLFRFKTQLLNAHKVVGIVFNVFHQLVEQLFAHSLLLFVLAVVFWPLVQ